MVETPAIKNYETEEERSSDLAVCLDKIAGIASLLRTRPDQVIAISFAAVVIDGRLLVAEEDETFFALNFGSIRDTVNVLRDHLDSVLEDVLDTLAPEV